MSLSSAYANTHRTGQYNYAVPGIVGTLLLTYGLPIAVPVRFDRQVTLDRVGVEFSTAGTAASTVRLGIWYDADDIFGNRPGNLVRDLGNIAGDAVAFVSATPSSTLTLGAGLYWFGCVSSSDLATEPTIRSIVSPPANGATIPASAAAAALPTVATVIAGVSGTAGTGAAFGSSWGATVTPVAAAPRVHFRVV